MAPPLQSVGWSGWATAASRGRPPGRARKGRPRTRRQDTEAERAPPGAQLVQHHRRPAAPAPADARFAGHFLGAALELEARLFPGKTRSTSHLDRYLRLSDGVRQVGGRRAPNAAAALNVTKRKLAGCGLCPFSPLRARDSNAPSTLMAVPPWS